MRNFRYDKVYGVWQEGSYPYFRVSDVLKPKSDFIYWWDIESGCITELSYERDRDSSKELMPLFVIGLEDLEFVVERKEGSDSIGYPKVIPIGKIKDLVNPEMLDAKECWEWVYVACQGYKTNEYVPEQQVKYLRVEPFARNSNSDCIWLINGEIPIYRLRKRVTFSKLESVYGRTKSFVKRKISYIEYKTDKLFNNTVVTLIQYLVIWLGTTALYHYYLEAAPTLGRAIISILLIPIVIFFHGILQNCANRVKKPFGVIARLSTNVFFGLGVSMFSMPIVTDSDREIFMSLSFMCLPTIIIPLLAETYLNKDPLWRYSHN